MTFREPRCGLQRAEGLRQSFSGTPWASKSIIIVAWSKNKELDILKIPYYAII